MLLDFFGLFKHSNIFLSPNRLDKLPRTPPGSWVSYSDWQNVLLFNVFGCVSEERWDSRSLGQRSAAELTQLKLNQTEILKQPPFYDLQKTLDYRSQDRASATCEENLSQGPEYFYFSSFGTLTQVSTQV